jgi:fibronectin-binding autotransporter adhesin
LAASGNFDVGSNGVLAINTTISGANSITKTGAGTLTLSGANTFSGGFNFGASDGSAAGTVAVGDNAALGTGTLTLRGIGASSTIRSDTATARTINNAIVFSGTGVDIHFRSASTGNLTFGGTVDLGTGNRTIEVDNATTTFSNTISGSGGITTAGSGTLVLGGSNTFTGGVTINSGTVQAGSITALGPAANAALTFGAGSTGKFQLNGNNTTIVDLTTNATVGTPVIENNNATVATLTVNTANSDTYGGVLQNGATGTLALAKSGSGTLTLGQ